MTGPLDESRPPRWSDQWGSIRTLTLAADVVGWRVDLDVDDDREPDESPRDVRLAVLAGENTCFQVTVPVAALRELAHRIGEL